MVTQETRTSSRLITAEIERLMPLHRQDDGTMDDARIAADLGVYIKDNLALLVDAESYARTKYTQYQESRGLYRSLHGGGRQLRLPDLDAIVQLGDNTSIILRDGRRSHLTKRLDLIRDQNDARLIAYTRELNIINTALGRMQRDTDTFEDVMSKDYTD